MNLIFGSHQLWVIIIGSLVPLGGYVLNRLGPWVDETVKAFVTVVLTAIATGLYTALDTNVFGWNNATVELVLTGVAAALLAHKLIWQPSQLNVKLGAAEHPPKRTLADAPVVKND